MSLFQKFGVVGGALSSLFLVPIVINHGALSESRRPVLASAQTGTAPLLSLIEPAVVEAKTPIVAAAAKKTVVAAKVPLLPSRLEIPKINVNAAVDNVGLTPSGAMDMISGIKDVAWFDKGAKPGEVGSAVIGGHYAGVFHNLTSLKTGDSIYVVDQQGVTRHFVVRTTKVYNATDSVPEVFASSDGAAHLNIITCNGAWVPSLKTYAKRFIVFTDLIS